MTTQASVSPASNSLTSTSEHETGQAEGSIGLQEVTRKSTGQATEMGVISGVALEQAEKVDRLSALPNELLDEIFDQAYTLYQPSTGPLSKRLLPFHISGLYRRVFLRKMANIVKFIEKINREPELGRLVRILGLESIGGLGNNLEAPEVHDFLDHLPNLKELSLDAKCPEIVDALLGPEGTHPPVHLPSLSRLSFFFEVKEEDFPLPRLARFPSLVSLEISDYECRLGFVNVAELPPLPNLKSVSVQGSFADDLSVASFCSLCPNLSSLCLETASANYASILPALPKQLRSLDLSLDYFEGNICDHLLTRFTSLEFLQLDGHLFSPDLGTHLAHLRSLRRLDLGLGRLDIDQFLPLVSGPTRLPLLKRLDLELVNAWIGPRLEVNVDGSTRGRLPEEGRLTARDWHLPEFDFEGGAAGGSFTVEKVRELVRVATTQGIEVQGSVVEGLEVVDAYQLEVANVAVCRSYRHKDLRHIAELRANYPHFCGRLPSLDLDSLDPTKLKLVKMELREEEWFSLTLET